MSPSKLIFIIPLIFISINVHAQNVWETIYLPHFKWNIADRECVLIKKSPYSNNGESNNIILHNYHAETNENGSNNTFSCESVSMNLSEWQELAPWKIGFVILNKNNRPDLYKYAVINENGKSMWHKKEIYWGFSIDPCGGSHTYQMMFCNTKSYPYFYECENNGSWTESNHYIPLTISIEYDGKSTIRICIDNLTVHTFYNTTSIQNINIFAGPAAEVHVENFYAFKKTLYGIVELHIKEGDYKCKNKDYWGAIEEYSKAIDEGYVNYNIYYKRASAYYAMEFYRNAIDDYTMALSYEKNEDAYLFRGLSKLQQHDSSCIEDLMMGGDRGRALAKELGVDINGERKEYPCTYSKYISSGTGFFIDSRGYIATNYHVINEAKGIDILVTKDGKTVTYKAKSIVQDKTNDLAIVKIDDENFANFSSIPYTIGHKTIDVGSSIFAMGYPELSYLGEEIKVTDGIISSKTGYQGDVATYQISAPIQPGNSGGPLFDKYGNLVGIINAGIPSMQNVGYAIKVSYLNNLIEASPEVIWAPSSNKLEGLSLADKIKIISPFIVIIKIY